MAPPEIAVVSPPAAARRRSRFPIVVVSLLLLALAVPRGWDWLDTESGPPLLLKLICSGTVAVCAILLLVWFLAFSPVRRRLRLRLLAVLIVSVVGFAGSVRKVEFTGSWLPVFLFRWEPDSEVLLEEHRQTQPTAADLPVIDLTIDPQRDFPRYRGRNGNGLVRGLDLATDWQALPPRPMWRQPAGGGYAGFAVAGNVAVTIEQRRDQEAVVCYDRATGRERWIHAYPTLFHRSEPMGGDGPRATPTIADGDVYALGAAGRLTCLDGTTGQVRWSMDILEDNRAKNVEWGMSGSPLIVGDRVIVNPGIDPGQNTGRSLAAYDRKTGRHVWANGDHPAAYSSPQLAELCGQRQILLFDAAGLASFDPENGQELWSYPWPTTMDMNITQPLVVGTDGVFISSELENGCALVRVRREGESYRAEPAWKNRNMNSKFSNPVTTGDHIYGLSYGILTVNNRRTRSASRRRSQPILPFGAS